MSVVPHFFHARVRADTGGARRGWDEAQTLAAGETTVLALVCRTQKPPDSYDDEAFRKDAQRAAEDVCYWYRCSRAR
jgi:hypothetical protein